MTYKQMYRISRGTAGGYYNYVCQQMCGLYDSLDAAREQLPDDWVRDRETDAEKGGEAYYMPGTDEDAFDGYDVLVMIRMEMVPVDDMDEDEQAGC